MEGDGGSKAHGGSFPPPPLDIAGKLALKKKRHEKKKRAQTQMCCETFIAATAVSLRLTEEGQPTRLLLLLFSLSLSFAPSSYTRSFFLLLSLTVCLTFHWFAD